MKLFDKNSVLCVVALSNVLNAMAPVPPKNFLLLLSVRQRKTFHEALPKNFGYFVHQKSYQDDHFYCLPTPSWSLVVEFWIWECKISYFFLSKKGMFYTFVISSELTNLGLTLFPPYIKYYWWILLDLFFSCLGRDYWNQVCP